MRRSPQRATTESSDKWCPSQPALAQDHRVARQPRIGLVCPKRSLTTGWRRPRGRLGPGRPARHRSPPRRIVAHEAGTTTNVAAAGTFASCHYPPSVRRHVRQESVPGSRRPPSASTCGAPRLIRVATRRRGPACQWAWGERGMKSGGSGAPQEIHRSTRCRQGCQVGGDALTQVVRHGHRRWISGSPVAPAGSNRSPVNTPATSSTEAWWASTSDVICDNASHTADRGTLFTRCQNDGAHRVVD